jgi:ADP-ribosylglycohydrolase
MLLTSVARGVLFKRLRAPTSILSWLSLVVWTSSSSAASAVTTGSHASAPAGAGNSPSPTNNMRLPSGRALAERAAGAVYGIVIGDSLSMPVHWYYRPSDIQAEYGVLRDLAPAPRRHPSSILNLSNTGGGGRGRQDGDIIGRVINHGKKEFWGVPNMHYHQGMGAGESTLNALCARLVVRTVTQSVVARGAYTPSDFLPAYVSFMTTPGSHNDTYAETFHRMFFANWARGVPPERCADDDGHNVASMGGLVMVPPPVLQAAAAAAAVAATPVASDADGAGRAAAVAAAARRAARTQVLLTHNNEAMARSAEVYAELLAAVLLLPEGQTAAERIAAFRELVAAAGRRLGVDLPALVSRNPAFGPAADTAVIGMGTFSSACYISDSLPALLYLAFKYAGDPEAALVSNTNVGGENCHRGSALGALMGTLHGPAGWPARWVQGLAARAEVQREAEAFGEVVASAAAAAAAAAAPAPAAAAAVGGSGDVAIAAGGPQVAE